MREQIGDGERGYAGAPLASGVAASDGQLSAGPSPLLASATFLRQLEGVTLRSRRRQAFFGQGDRRSPLRGNSLQLVDYRPYVAGDDLRQVDWNVYSRSGELFVRLYEDERTLTVHLLVDVSRSMDWGAPNKRQIALGLASILSYIALSSFDRLHVAFVADRVVGQAGPFWGPPQRSSALKAIADAPLARQTDLAASITSYTDRLRQPGLLILITDLLSPTADEGLRRVAGVRHEAIVIQILSPQELDPEPAEDLTLVDHETGSTIDLNLDLATLARYRERLDEWTGRISRLCRERNARFVRVSTGDDLERDVIRSFRRNGILQ
jgi:uncharacterized protein (DUF58 family)